MNTLPDREARENKKHLAWIRVAMTVASLSTCTRRQVGCVLVSTRGHIMSTGYNGPASGERHCTDNPCAGARYPSGEGLDKCEAIHAEANALIQCRNHLDIATAYVTAFPCTHCAKMLLNTSCASIYFAEHYAHPDALKLWQRSNRVAMLIPNL